MDDVISDSHRYFRAIEDHFIGLRGAPLLLSPADHLVARSWFEAGIPLEVVLGALDTVFERRKERGSTRRVSSLRYCRPAVEKEWKRVAALRATDTRAAAPDSDVPGQLARLAGTLPPNLPERAAWIKRITSLEGDPEAVEEELIRLDRELLESLISSMTDDQRQATDQEIDRAMHSLRGRLPAQEIEAGRERLRRQAVRERFSVPLLSLFGA